jgi:mycothione reductase
LLGFELASAYDGGVLTSSATAREFDVIIIGTGSGNSVPTPELDGLRVAIIEKDVFGGTCLNRGCIPTKMFVYVADVVLAARRAGKLGVDMEVSKVRWKDIVDRVFGRIDPIPPAGLRYRQSLSNTTVFSGVARFVDTRVVEVTDGDGAVSRLTAPQIVVATGASPAIPDLPGLESVGYHTSDTIMRLTDLPERVVIVGGGFIAAEMAHVFGALGSTVSIVTRGPSLLSREDESVSERFTRLATEQYDCHLSSTITAIHQDGTGDIVVELLDAQGGATLRSDVLLIATGRAPSGKELDVGAAGLLLDQHGYLVTDEFMQTNVPGIWALGDVTSPHQLKHTANAEARVVAHNIVHPESPRAVDLWPTPHAVFASAQIASVGATEAELRATGQPYMVAQQGYGDVAYGWAMEDTDHFCKLLADPDTRLLLGAHLIGPQSSILIQQLIQGMKFGQTVDDMARGLLYIHPALTEVVENALLQF